MDKARRKELMQAYSERKPATGVFAVKCAPTGEAWVGWSKSLDKRQNALWFQLRAGMLLEAPDLAIAWKTHGEDAFTYETLEEISEDDPHKLGRLLEERMLDWRAKLDGKPIANR